MANRYTEYNPQQYVSTYVPLPLEEIAKAGAMKQQQFDTGKAEFQGAADMIKIKSDPHREAIRDQLLSSYNSEINALADEYTKTGDNSLISKVNDLKRRYANDQIRLGLEKSAANYEKLQKDAEEYKKTGKYADFYDPYNTDSAMNPDGSFKAFDYTGMLSSENINEEAKKQMGKIAEDGSAFEGMVRDKQGNLIIDPQGAYWSTKSSGSGVKEAKVVSLAKAKADSFLGSEAGRYFIDKQFGQHVDYSSLDNDTKNQLKTLAAQYLVQASAEQIGWTTKSGNDASFAPEDIRHPKFENPNTGSIAPGDTKSNSINLSNGEDISSYFDDNGNFQFHNLFKNRGHSLPTDKTIMEAHSFADLYRTMTERGMDTKTVNELAAIGFANGMSKKSKPSDVVEFGARFLQNLKNSSSSVYIPTANNSTGINNKILSGGIDLSKMKLDDKSSLLEYAKSSGKTPLFNGIAYENGEAKLRFKVGDEYKTTTIPNNSYTSYLKPIAVTLKDVTDKAAKTSNRKPDEIKAANDMLIMYSQNAERDNLGFPTNENGARLTSEFNPIGATPYKGGIVYSYVNKSTGDIGIIYTDSNNNVHSAPRLSDFEQIETDDFFKTPEAQDLNLGLSKASVQTSNINK